MSLDDIAAIQKHTETLLDKYPDFLTVSDVANLLQLSPACIQQLMQSGQLLFADIHGNSRIPKPFLIEYLVSCSSLCYTRGVKPNAPAPSGQEPMHLDNHITPTDILPVSEGVTEMANKKINQSVVVNGTKVWVRANSLQEFTNKILQLAATPQESSKHPFDTYAWNWFNTYSKPNVENATAITYQRQLTLHLLPAFEGLAVEDITTDHIQKLFNNMTGAKATKDKVRIVLNQILDAAVEDKIITQNPVKSRRVKITGKASKATAPYTVEQMRFLVEHLGDIQSPQDRAYLALQALHPLRLEEVLGLQLNDVDTQNMKIHVRRAVTHPTRNQPEVKDTKTASSCRTIGLSALALPYLSTDFTGPFLFGGQQPLSYTQVRRMCQRIQREIGFEENITPIRFRTTVLTDLYDQTKDIKLAQAAAGHTTPAMTLKYYVKGRETSTEATNAVERAYTA